MAIKDHPFLILIPAGKDIKMFHLEKREFLLMAALVSSLVLGMGIAAYRMAHRGATVTLKHYDAEGLKLMHADDIINNRSTININEASEEELMKLKGVGRAIAGRIAEYRSSKGNFRSISDIKNVKGIGEKLFERIKDDISIE